MSDLSKTMGPKCHFFKRTLWEKISRERKLLSKRGEERAAGENAQIWGVGGCSEKVVFKGASRKKPDRIDANSNGKRLQGNSDNGGIFSPGSSPQRQPTRKHEGTAFKRGRAALGKKRNLPGRGGTSIRGR